MEARMRFFLSIPSEISRFQRVFPNNKRVNILRAGKLWFKWKPIGLNFCNDDNSDVNSAMVRFTDGKGAQNRLRLEIIEKLK
jgi:hypothetical protein